MARSGALEPASESSARSDRVSDSGRGEPVSDVMRVHEAPQNGSVKDVALLEGIRIWATTLETLMRSIYSGRRGENIIDGRGVGVRVETFCLFAAVCLRETSSFGGVPFCCVRFGCAAPVA